MVENVCSGGINANVESSQSPVSSLVANEIIAFTTCQSTEFDRTTCTKAQLDRMVSTLVPGGEITVNIPVVQDGQDSPNSISSVELANPPTPNVQVNVQLPPEVQGPTLGGA